MLNSYFIELLKENRFVQWLPKHYVMVWLGYTQVKSIYKVLVSLDIVCVKDSWGDLKTAIKKSVRSHVFNRFWYNWLTKITVKITKIIITIIYILKFINNDTKTHKIKWNTDNGKQFLPEPTRFLIWYNCNKYGQLISF